MTLHFKFNFVIYLHKNYFQFINVLSNLKFNLLYKKFYKLHIKFNFFIFIAF